MPPSHLWPTFPLDRILYEDDAIIVIDKLVGIPTHGADAARSDDALTRLRLGLAERDGVSPDRVYLGTHQRLDRDTSGALLFTRRKEANGAIASQFEKREVKKTYVAVVTGWPLHLQQGTLTHDIAPAAAGRMHIVGAPGRGEPRVEKATPRSGGRKARPPLSRAAPEDSRRAVTRYRVLQRAGARALIELHPETGRTHQLRVQLTAAGGAIAGDCLYGGEPAPRLMLHATRLTLAHPSTGAPLDVCAPLPRELEAWLTDPKRAVGVGDARFDGRLRAAVDLRFALGRSKDTTAFRLVHGEGDGVLGLAIDIYGEHLLVHFFSDEALAERDAVLDKAFALGPRGVYMQVHPKQSSTIVDPRTPEFAPALPLRGEPADPPLWVLERGLAFRVALGEGLKTGIFLDQRDNRQRVRELSAGKRVLNLFAYTCGFTVAAAAGGARETMSVDTSAAALAWGAENLAHNDLASASHAFAAADVFTWLKLATKRGERYDLVVLDPPSYATTKTSRFSAENDLPDLASRALALLAPGGRMLACTNHRGITVGRFRRLMHEAGRLAARSFLQMKDLPPSEDFPSAEDGNPQLKSALITVE